MTKEKAVELGCSFETETPTQDEIDAKVASRLAELTGENSKLHSTISKVNSENAEYKRKEQARLTDDEKKEAHTKEVETKLAEYERRFAKQDKVNDYLAVGYPKELAEEIAEAELNGKPTGSLHQKFVAQREESLKKELLKNSPQAKQTDPNAKEITYDAYKKMTYSEKMKLKEDNPTLFEQYHNRK